VASIGLMKGRSSQARQRRQPLESLGTQLLVEVSDRSPDGATSRLPCWRREAPRRLFRAKAGPWSQVQILSARLAGIGTPRNFR
jgi:hypothetical protein